MDLREQLFQEFRDIIDLESGKSIVDLGIVQEIEINEDAQRVYVYIRLSHFNPRTDFYEQRIRDIVEGHGYEPEIEVLMS